ncbi:MAG: hypothetical protein AB7E80_05470 [Hyphomicrobiaceae bacterium]
MAIDMMMGPTSEIPAVAYTLADHLDAALAAAEDLTAAGNQWCHASAGCGGCEITAQAAERAVMEAVRREEARLIGRVMLARRRADELAREADGFSSLARLFGGGTAVLCDAVEDLSDSTLADFATGDCTLAYLRSRGLVASEAPCLPESSSVTFDSRFLVAARLPLATMVDMIVAFLDALEARYDLYPDEQDSRADGHEEAHEEAVVDVMPPRSGVIFRTDRADNGAQTDEDEEIAPAITDASPAEAPTECDTSPVPATCSASQPEADVKRTSRLMDRLEAAAGSTDANLRPDHQP